ncbi:MAG: cation:proton antiporter [Longimonas sp.]|uniref:cation:proton antiporter n=1 Tax=Longimonas sp. TaxID=2039626 RepID=UPI0033583F21
MFSLPITDPVLVFATVMLIVLLAPILFRRLGLPGIVGLIVAGAVVGPNAIGLLERGDTFELLGTVGLLYLMFTAGLSMDLNQFAQQKSRSFVFGLISFLMPQLLALGIGTMLLGWDVMTALLVGAVVGSHTLLAYPIAERLGITKNPAVTMTMGGTMVTDLVSLLILAIVSALVSGESGVLFWTQFATLVVAYGLVIFFVLPRIGRWFFQGSDRQADMEFIFLLAIVFVAAYAAELVYLAPIIGAFMTGIALNRLVPERSALMLRIKFVGDALFIPFFLISVGMLVDAAVLVQGLDVWIMAIVLTFMVWAGKFLAAQGVQWIYGYSSTERWVIFGLSTPQAAATLAVTLIGFEIGLFDEALVNAVILLIVATSVLGPSLVEKYGRELALQAEREAYSPSEVPQRIMVPLSNPESADDLMDVAVLLRSGTSDEPIYPTTVVRDGPNVEEGVARGESILSKAVIQAAAAEVPVVPSTRVDYNVVDGMVRAIKEERISTVVIGWQGTSSAREYIFGSILDQLLERTRQMVIVSRFKQPMNTHTRMVLAVPPYADRESGFGDAMRALKVLCNQAGLELVVVAAEASMRPLAKRIDATKPSLPWSSVSIDRWAQLVSKLDEIVEPEDLLVLMNEREGSIAWRPGLDRLPGVIAQRFEEHTFLTAYMSEEAFRPGQSGRLERVDPAVLAEAVRPECVVMGVQQETTPDVLRHIMRCALGNQPDTIEAVLPKLLDADGYAPELRPGVVLYAAHTRHVETTSLLVGISADGVSPKQTSQPAHIVLVLLVPRTVPTDAYLQRLAAAAELIQTEEVVEALRTAETSKGARKLLLEHTRTVPVEG